MINIIVIFISIIIIIFIFVIIIIIIITIIIIIITIFISSICNRAKRLTYPLSVPILRFCSSLSPLWIFFYISLLLLFLFSIFPPFPFWCLFLSLVWLQKGLHDYQWTNAIHCIERNVNKQKVVYIVFKTTDNKGSQPRNFLCVEILKQICLPSLGIVVFRYYYYYFYYYYYKWSWF